MFPIVRIYQSEAQAREAARELDEAGFDRVSLLTSGEGTPPPDDVVRDAVAAGCVGAAQATLCLESLRRGRSAVGVYAPFGSGVYATEILERHGPARDVRVPSSSQSNAAPLSDALGLPVLTKYTPMTDLSIVKYSFGEPKLSSKAAPLSSMFGLKTLTKSRSKKSSMGLPLLSSNPAPLSSLFRMKTLTESKSKDTSFGFSLLSKNPTPISSLFGIRVLTKRDRDD